MPERPTNNPGFSLAEDAALKHRLSSLTVSDDRESERIVSVFFRYPEGETEKMYPFMTIDLLDVAHSRERQESERNYYFMNDASERSIDYYPSEFSTSELSGQLGASAGIMVTDQIVPVDLIYQVTTYCRSQRHDRQLMMLMLRRVFPFRRGFIEVPEDGTIRRCDLLDWQQNDLLDQEAGYKKRIFRKVLTLRINAEIPQSDFTSVQRVLEVQGTLTEHNPAFPDNTYPLEDF